MEFKDAGTQETENDHGKSLTSRQWNDSSRRSERGWWKEFASEKIHGFRQKKDFFYGRDDSRGNEFSLYWSLHILYGLTNHVLVHPCSGQTVTNHKGIITNDIDHAWKSSRMLNNHGDGVGGEHLSTPASDQLESMINIVPWFFFR